MKITSVVCTPEGGSRFEEIEIEQTLTPYAENVPPLLVSAPMPAQAAVFLSAPVEMREMAPHPAPRRQLIVVLTGDLEAETSDGERRRFGPGDIVLAADTEGQGHVTRIVGDTPATLLAVPLATESG